MAHSTLEIPENLDSQRQTSKKQSKIFCDGCSLVFHSKGILDNHKLICTRSLNPKSTGSSFYNAWHDLEHKKNETHRGVDVEKILPNSQPLLIPELEKEKEDDQNQYCQFYKNVITVQGALKHYEV